MKVRDVMRKEPAYCRLDTNVAAAVEIMWKNGCGFLPVVGDGGNVVAVVTDRDVCVALGTRSTLASELPVGDVTPLKLFACTADDDIHSALSTIRAQRIRRLPVIDSEGALQGVLSMDDVVLHARECGGRQDLCWKDVIETYRAIYGNGKARVAA